MKWIACKDQMPKEEKLVIFMYSGYCVRLGGFSYEDNQWYVAFWNADDDFLLPKDAVTHWLPLPELPYIP